MFDEVQQMRDEMVDMKKKLLMNVHVHDEVRELRNQLNDMNEELDEVNSKLGSIITAMALQATR